MVLRSVHTSSLLSLPIKRSANDASILPDDETPQNERTAPLSVLTRESDQEDHAAAESGTFYSDEGVHYVDSGLDTEQGGLELEDGMLPRDLPQRTTFYDPVAERQMSQTDAKLFYQRSRIDGRTGSGVWSHPAAHGSPLMLSRSQPPTEYGADSVILEEAAGRSRSQWQHKLASDGMMAEL
jgi:AMP deaminase